MTHGMRHRGPALTCSRFALSICLLTALAPRVAGQATEPVNNNRPEGFREIASIEIESDGLGIHYHQGLILVAGGTHGLMVVDVSEPTSPRKIGQVAIKDNAVAVTARGTYAYVSAGPAGWPVAHVNIVDISDPRAPSVIAVLEMPDYPAGLAVDDEVLYVADGSEGLRVVSVTDATAPREIAAVTDIGPVSVVALSGHHAVVSGHEGTVTVIDVSSPDKPATVGRIQLSGEIGRLAVAGKSAFVCMGEDGIAVLDISDPSRPKRLRDVDTPGVAVAVFAESDRLVIADVNGLSVARGKNHADVKRIHTDENRLTFDVASGDGHIFVLDGLEPVIMYGLFGKIAIRVVKLD